MSLTYSQSLPPMNRRDAFKLLTTAPLAAGFSWTPTDVARASERAAQAPLADTPAFFTEQEYETVHLLVDLILPADDRFLDRLKARHRRASHTACRRCDLPVAGRGPNLRRLWSLRHWSSDPYWQHDL